MYDEILRYKDLALAPVIMALVSLIGLTPWGQAHRKLLPALAAILGILAGILVGVEGDRVLGALYGILWAAGAVGMHSGTKNVREWMER